MGAVPARHRAQRHVGEELPVVRLSEAGRSDVVRTFCCNFKRRGISCDCAERDRIAKEKIEAAGITREAIDRLNFAETVALAERLGVRPQDIVGYWMGS